MSDSLDKHMGQRVKHYRKLRGLTRAQFAKKANMSIEYYKKIESGRACIKIPTLKKLTAAAGVCNSPLVCSKPTVQEFFKFLDYSPLWILKCFEKVEQEANNVNTYWMKYIGEKHPGMGDVMLRMIDSALKAETL